jgi:hypothetical protein
VPPIRSVSIGDNTFSIADRNPGGIRTLQRSDVPSGNTTIAQIENWIHTVWVPANIEGYQLRVHIFSLGPPVRWTVWTGNLGVAIPATWWVVA